MSAIEETMEKLQQGVDGVFESKNYKQYLKTMSKFHSYSVSNCILIGLQRPDASRVAGYTAWRDKFHRQVVKGEKGIKIIAPTFGKRKQEVEKMDETGQKILDENGNPVREVQESEYRGFRVTTVFDISQTEGEPLPELVSELIGPVEGFDDYMDSIKDLSPVPIRFDTMEGSTAKGYYSPARQEIVIRRGMSEEQTLKTALHEVAHCRLGHGSEDDHEDRRTHEVQAESVAYCCCCELGLDTSDYSFGYIAGWSSGKEQKELKASLDVIREQADQMISGIETKMAQIMEMRAQNETMEEQKIQVQGIKMAM